MCDPVTLGIAAISGAAALFGGGNDSPPPPPPVIKPPSMEPAATRKSGAEVKLGDNAAGITNGSTPTYGGFAEKRVFGKPLGGLGRGGLSL